MFRRVLVGTVTGCDIQLISRAILCQELDERERECVCVSVQVIENLVIRDFIGEILTES